MLEKQFENLFKKASGKSGITGEVLLQYCEARLDNVVYRMGMANSRAAARQLVSHRHVTVGGEVCNIPSRSIKPGEVIGVREKSKSLEVVSESLAANPCDSAWLSWNGDNMTGEFMHYPTREEIPENINEQLIVELYSK
jgi:small subunit ribosomal protein S4